MCVCVYVYVYIDEYVWICWLVFGTSTFQKKDSSGTIQPIANRIRGFIPSPRVFVRKRT